MGLSSIKRKSLVWAVLLIVFLGQSLIPSGFMPGQATPSSDHDRFSLVICSGLSTKTIILDQNGLPLKEQNHDRKTADNSVCPYATLAGKTILPLVVAPEFPSLVLLSSPALSTESTPVQTATFRPEARGPPVPVLI